MKTILYLIRHAQSYPTSRQHHSEWPLSSLGKNQAHQLGILLEKLTITRIFSSPFTRCIQTVKPFADKSIIPIVIENDLRERLIANNIINDFYNLWCKSWEDFNFALPGCETSAQAQERFVKAVSKLADSNRGNIIALCTHGNVMGLFLNWIDKSAGRMVAERLRNPDVIRVTMSDEKFNWDKQFILPGLNSISTDHNETPVEK